MSKLATIPNLPPRISGFTLVELVMTMIIIAVLATMAMPRFVDQPTFEARGFYDQTMSLLHYAQKTAIAQHRTVCVSLNSTGATLTIASASHPSTTCNTVLALPTTPRAGSGLSATPANFKFLALGATDQTTNISITVAGSSNITVDAVTGNVY